MKLFLGVMFICLFINLSCQSQIKSLKPRASLKFLYKTEIDTTMNNYGSHIEVKQVLPDTIGYILMSIDDRDIISRSNYSRNDEIRILGEYLAFRGDTNMSNKKYLFKSAYHMEKPEDIENFTVQIEALYSFTRMLTIGYPPIKPMLINKITGERLNANPKIISEVFDIYQKWYKVNKKNNFQNISLPLFGTQYSWLGEDKGMNYLIKKSL